jgi:hypothetical protein
MKDLEEVIEEKEDIEVDELVERGLIQCYNCDE